MIVGVWLLCAVILWQVMYTLKEVQDLDLKLDALKFMVQLLAPDNKEVKDLNKEIDVLKELLQPGKGKGDKE